MGVASTELETASIIWTGIFYREFCKGNHSTNQSILGMSYIGFLSLFEMETLITFILSESSCCIVSYNLATHVHNYSLDSLKYEVSFMESDFI